MASQAMGETAPTGPPAIRPKDGAEQHFHAAWPHQRPWCSGLELAPIHFGKAWLEIVIADHDGEIGISSPTAAPLASR